MIRFIKLALSILFIALLTTSCEKELSDVTGNLPGTGIDTTNNGGGTSCGVPSGVSGISTVAGEATINWTVVTGAISYSVQYRVYGTSTWSSQLSSATSITITALTPSSNYEFQVQSICASGASAFSSSTSLTPSGNTTSCDVPSGLTATAITSTSAMLNWTAVTGASSYNVQYKAVSASSWMTASSNTNSTSITGLTAGTAYEFQVQTVCSSGNSSYSASYTFTTTTIVLPSVCKACSYQPWCDGSTYNYIDTTDGVPGPVAETITILGDTMIGSGGSIMHYDVTLTNAGDTVYHNCDSINQISTLILNINQGGVSTRVKSVLIKSNLPVGGTWTETATVSGLNISINYSIIAKGISRTVPYGTFYDVIHVRQRISATIIPGFPATQVSQVDYYYANAVGLIESLTNSTFPGSTPSVTHRVLIDFNIP